MADRFVAIAGIGTDHDSADLDSAQLKSKSSASVLQANSLWQSADNSQINSQPQEVKVNVADETPVRAKIDINASEFVGTFSIGKNDKIAPKERTKLVESLDQALNDQKFYAMADFATPVIIIGAALASKYSKPLAFGIGLPAALGNKIYSHEQDLAAGERANQAIRKMPLEDVHKFGKFQNEMNASRETSQSAYVPFGIYTLASFVPQLKMFFNTPGSVILGAGAVSLDSYHTFYKRPQIYRQFRSEVESWDKK